MSEDTDNLLNIINSAGKFWIYRLNHYFWENEMIHMINKTLKNNKILYIGSVKSEIVTKNDIILFYVVWTTQKKGFMALARATTDFAPNENKIKFFKDNGMTRFFGEISPVYLIPKLLSPKIIKQFIPDFNTRSFCQENACFTEITGTLGKKLSNIILEINNGTIDPFPKKKSKKINNPTSASSKSTKSTKITPKHESKRNPYSILPENDDENNPKYDSDELSSVFVKISTKTLKKLPNEFTSSTSPFDNNSSLISSDSKEQSKEIKKSKPKQTKIKKNPHSIMSSSESTEDQKSIEQPKFIKQLKSKLKLLSDSEDSDTSSNSQYEKYINPKQKSFIKNIIPSKLSSSVKKINPKSIILNNQSDTQSDTQSDNGSDNELDNGSDNELDNGSDNELDNGSDNELDNGSDNESENQSKNQSDTQSDKMSDNGSDNMSDNGSDNQSGNGSDNESENQSDKMSDNGYMTYDYDDLDNSDEIMLFERGLGNLPILFEPCDDFEWVNDREILHQNFCGHFSKCDNCSFTDNNETNLSKYFGIAKFAYCKIRDNNKADELIDNYKSFIRMRLGIDEDNPNIYIKVMKISIKSHYYNNCCIILWE